MLLIDSKLEYNDFKDYSVIFRFQLLELQPTLKVSSSRVEQVPMLRKGDASSQFSISFTEGS